ncbi:MAG: D-alanine--D-alanine ligase [Bdellovibrionaceae bacterium]|nr:D-alanine--D-alanine ligase [Pseudobdellovibrionaceae bacterium]
MSKLKVGILFGGKSGEHEVSIVSATSIYKALDKEKYDVYLIGIDKDGRWLLPADSQLLANTQDPRLLQLNKENTALAVAPYKHSAPLTKISDSPHGFTLDVFFPVLHGTHGEDGTVQGLLELMQIPYVGSGVLGSAVGMDKDISRRLLRGAGIPVVDTITIRQHEYKTNPKIHIHNIIDKLGLPFFIKPANAGSSVGVHKIKSMDEAESKIADAFLFDSKILAEKAISARELECAVLGNEEPRASIIGEIVPRHEFYTYEAKYIDENGADLLIPAKNITPELTQKLQKYSLAAFQCLELKGMARVDYLVDKVTNEIYLNEVNTIPGFTKISMYPKLWEASGLPYSQLLDELIRLAIEHKEIKSKLKTTYEK